MIRAPAGLGKTSLVVEMLADRTDGAAELYVPTHALGEEVGRNLLEANPALSVKVVAGRSHLGTDGKPLCRKHEIAEEVARGGGEVYPSLCARVKGKSEVRCKYYDSCPYINQFSNPAQVTIYPHAYLPLERTRLEPGVPKTAIIDETFIMSCIERFEVPLALLRAPCGGPMTSRVCAEIEHALTQGLPLFDRLWSENIFFAELQTAIDEIKTQGPAPSPAMNTTEQRAALKQLKQPNLLRKLLELVRRDYCAGRPASQAVQYCSDTQRIFGHNKKWLRRLHDRQGNEASVLIIDANADQELIGRFFDHVEFITIPAQRQAKVIQCHATRCSTTSLVPKKNKDPKSKRKARKRLRELEAYIARVAVQHPRVLVVGPQAITGNLKKRVKPLISVAANVELAHFNAIRGIDQWKNHDVIVVIGRNQLPIEELEAIARCVFLTDRAPLQFAKDWTVEVRGYRWKHGTMGVDVLVHPDPRIQALHEQLREGESQQAIDRLRLVHGSKEKIVHLLSNVVLDVDVDHLVTWEEMMNGGGRFEQAWKTLNGVMPLAPEWLATRFPQHWKTADAAKADVARAIKECQLSNMITIRNPTLFRHQYRPAVAPSGARRQRAWSVCVSNDADPAATRVALAALLGVGVELRRPEGLGEPLQQSTKSRARSAATQRQARTTKYRVRRFSYLGRHT